VPGGSAELDATGCYVLPGAVDPHVHLHMPAGPYVSADDFGSGTIAAALGGTTSVIDFVEPEPGESLLSALARRRAQAEGAVAVDYGLHMTVPAWHAGQPESLEALSDVLSAGVPSFKLYMAYEGFRLDDVQLLHAMRAISAVGGLPLVHCENGPLCDLLRAEAVARGDISPIDHARSRPPRQEAEAVGRAIDIAALAGSRLYVVHVSCRMALARIRRARREGQDVYAETGPQYLLLVESLLAGPNGERLVCSPPLRTEADHGPLWDALASGDLDVLATDHCPFTAGEKAGHADFTTIPGGLPGVEARLSLAYHFGRQHGLSLERWVEVCCTTPARVFGLATKGHIAIGLDADLVVFDPQREVTLRAGETLHERVDWSPYEGVTIRGWPRDVLSRGRVIVRRGTFVGQPGWGRFVRRERTTGCA
jgi:dihydropyrimidinase